jgi:uncharacterized paraquat-inducible protein A
MKSLNESIREVEGKKRTLEETVDSLNEEITQIKAAEQMHKVGNNFIPVILLLTVAGFNIVITILGISGHFKKRILTAFMKINVMIILLRTNCSASVFLVVCRKSIFKVEVVTLTSDINLGFQRIRHPK